VRQAGRSSLLCITPSKSWAQLHINEWPQTMMYEGCHNNASLNMQTVMHKWGGYAVHSIETDKRTTFCGGGYRFWTLVTSMTIQKELQQNAVCTNIPSCFVETYSIELMMKSHWKSNMTMAITYLLTINNNVMGTIFIGAWASAMVKELRY
jgi:hypothetical protein